MATDSSLFIFLSDYIVTIYAWRDGQFSQQNRFENSPAGQEAFGHHWQQTTPSEPVYLLVDMIEEELHNEMVPRLFGGNRQKMLTGRSSRMFRNTPFCYNHLYGRVSGEEQKEQVLFIGLTEPEKLLAWLTILHGCQARLAGVVSVPVLCQELFKKMAPGNQEALLVSPNAGGLRQIFLHNGRMLVSRFSAVHLEGERAVRETIRQEVVRMRGYLESLHLLSLHTPLDLFVLCPKALHQLLSSETEQVAHLNIHPVDAEGLARRLGFGTNLGQNEQLEPFFCGFLLKQRQRNHYARAADTRIYRALRLRARLGTASLSLFLVGVLVAGGLFWEGWRIQDSRPELLRQVAQAQQAWQEVAVASGTGEKGGTPSVGEGNVVAAVRTLDALRQNAATPQPLLIAISQVLNWHSDIWLVGLQWFAGLPDREGEWLQTTGLPAAEARALLRREGQKAGLHYVRLQGQFYPFSGQMMVANRRIQDFADALRGLPGVADVAVLSRPEDPTQTAVLDSHSTLASPTEAPFALWMAVEAGRYRHE
ncbi:MAG: hypothetical protein HQL90_06885 [Magnetococcales bacterium]|nr:hypothetical protein [Magnetococcales bacterium]